MLTLDVYLVFVQHHMLLVQLLFTEPLSLERQSAGDFRPAHAACFTVALSERNLRRAAFDACAGAIGTTTDTLESAESDSVTITCSGSSL